MGLITSAEYVEVVELPHKRVVCPRLRCILRIQEHPSVLKGLVFCQVVEIVTAFACVPTKEENTIFKGQTVRSRARGRHILLVLYLRADYGPDVFLLRG